jgi:DNA recombination protein RmuC
MPTEMLIFILYVITVAGFAGTIYFLWRFKQEQKKPEDNTAFVMLNQNLQGMQQGFNERLDNAAKAFGEIAELGRSMRSVQDLLKSQKLRGNLGEQLLQDLLQQILPSKSYEFQYRFKANAVVDAIVKTKNGLIPIDAKFPAENYQKAMATKDEDEQKRYLHEFHKDMRRHIDSISRKYILPSEGTVDFALMYLPTPAIYNEVTENNELFGYGSERKIYFVSPNTFYYFMQILLLAFSGEEIEKTAKAVLRDLQAVKKASHNFADELSVLNTHVGNAGKVMARVNDSFRRLKERIDNTGLLQREAVDEISEVASSARETIESLEEVELPR